MFCCGQVLPILLRITSLAAGLLQDQDQGLAPELLEHCSREHHLIYHGITRSVCIFLRDVLLIEAHYCVVYARKYVLSMLCWSLLWFGNTPFNTRPSGILLMYTHDLHVLK